MVGRIDKYESLNPITEKIIGCAYRVSNTLGIGFLEKVYENAMVVELRRNDLQIKQQKPFLIRYENIVVGEYFADMIVEDKIIVELKAQTALDKSHIAQCLNYLKATELPLALLINFGTSRIQVKRIVRG
jgi:GxxExxY protein